MPLTDEYRQHERTNYLSIPEQKSPAILYQLFAAAMFLTGAAGIFSAIGQSDIIAGYLLGIFGAILLSAGILIEGIILIIAELRQNRAATRALRAELRQQR